MGGARVLTVQARILQCFRRGLLCKSDKVDALGAKVGPADGSLEAKLACRETAGHTARDSSRKNIQRRIQLPNSTRSCKKRLPATLDPNTEGRHATETGYDDPALCRSGDGRQRHP